MGNIGDCRNKSLQSDAAGKALPGEKKIATSEDILALSAMAGAIRDDAIKLGLKFEGYLLDMAVTALHERVQK